MPSYYFTVGDSILPSEPAPAREFPDLLVALAAGRAAAQAIIQAGGRLAARPLKGHLDIQDEDHVPVARIMLSDIARQTS